MPKPTFSRTPSKEQVLDYIRNSPVQLGKRELVKAFGLKGAERIALKEMLRELADEGHIAKGPRKRFGGGGALPPMLVLEIVEVDSDGDLIAVPAAWEQDGPPPRVLIPAQKSEGAARGDRALTRVVSADHGPAAYRGQVVKRLSRGGRRVLGVYERGPQGGKVLPVDKRDDRVYMIDLGDRADALQGELVEIEPFKDSRSYTPRARVVARLGDVGAPKSISRIAIHEHGLPVEFSEEALKEAETAAPTVTLNGREDLRDLPLVTIDPADARDHDDAVYAHADDAADNRGGWVVWVAIADVAAYVRPGTALDGDAYKRGNSAYFPDRVVPMLPERLSADLCSLHEGVDRPCLAVRMRFDSGGRKIGHKFVRGLMRSAASLTYEQAQAAADGRPDAATDVFLEPVIKPLFAAYAAMAQARDQRAPMALDLPERRVVLNDAGEVTAITLRARMDAHRLIEECMIQANVCAAETLEDRRAAVMYRVHEPPNEERIDALRETLQTIGVSLAKGQQITPQRLNQALEAAAKTEFSETVSMMVLRAQSQAVYAPENLGHFGLNLRRYAHFTSPIRRYADLLIHRALIAAMKAGDDGLTPEEADRLEQIAQHISKTERTAMLAERDSTDRYLAAFLRDRIGVEFTGKISGVQRFGLFVKLDDTGADGLVPVASLADDYYRHDPDMGQLTGERYGRTFRLGQAVKARLMEAAPLSGGLLLNLVDDDAPRGGRRGKGGRTAAAQKLARKSAIKRAKVGKKARRMS